MGILERKTDENGRRTVQSSDKRCLAKLRVVAGESRNAGAIEGLRKQIVKSFIIK
jgi:hypothetical protein